MDDTILSDLHAIFGDLQDLRKSIRVCCKKRAAPTYFSNFQMHLTPVVCTSFASSSQSKALQLLEHSTAYPVLLLNTPGLFLTGSFSCHSGSMKAGKHKPQVYARLTHKQQIAEGSDGATPSALLWPVPVMAPEWSELLPRHLKSSTKTQDGTEGLLQSSHKGLASGQNVLFPCKFVASVGLMQAFNLIST